MTPIKVFSACLMIVMSLTAFSQNSISVEFIHKLNAHDFSLSQDGMTSAGIRFRTERLEYYLSEFSITHDGGQVTNIPDSWVLMNATESGMVDLGTHSIDSVESITFGLGVNPEVNNQDPSQWPSEHPLAHKVPSMHWGWASGYRYVAFEGTSNGQEFELHALGTKNYQYVTIPVNQKIGSNYQLDVYANYSRAFDEIDISQGMIVHSLEDEAILILNNFAEAVFSLEAPTDTVPIDTTTSISQVHQSHAGFRVFPNPLTSSIKEVEISSEKSLAGVSVYNVTGKEVSDVRLVDGKLEMPTLQSGLYFIQVDFADGSAALERLIVH